MTTYRVKWVKQLEADNPVRAAQQAMLDILDLPLRNAWFEVEDCDHQGPSRRIDLASDSLGWLEATAEARSMSVGKGGSVEERVNLLTDMVMVQENLASQGHHVGPLERLIELLGSEVHTFRPTCAGCRQQKPVEIALRMLQSCWAPKNQMCEDCASLLKIPAYWW